MTISKISMLSDLEFQKLVDESISIRQFLQLMGLSTNGTSSYKCFYNEVEKRKISLVTLKENKKQYLRKVSCNLKYKNNQNRKPKARTILLNSGVEYKCCLCGQLPIHNGKPLTIQLDHINGNHQDDSLQNLRFLCPNCHTQTDTYGSKKIKIVSLIKKESKKKFIIEKDKLIELIKTLPLTKIGKLFKVSDNAIKKRAIALGIDIKQFSPFSHTLMM